MANNQPDRTASYHKKPDTLPVKVMSPSTPDILGQQNETLLMEQAIETPEQAQPGTVLKLHNNYGNNEIKRVLNPQPAKKPVINQGGELSKYVSDEIQRARSGGSPLSGQLNQQIGSQMGNDFSQVRLHTDHTADRLAGTLQARAFTIGKNIFFRQGAYAPQTSQGRFTLMHELTHVMQQSGSPSASGPLKLGPTHDSYESEANHMASSQAGSMASAQAVHGGLIQRVVGATGSVAPSTIPPRRLPPPPPPPRTTTVLGPTIPATLPGSSTGSTTGVTTAPPRRLPPPPPTTPHPVRGGSPVTAPITLPTAVRPTTPAVITNPVPPAVLAFGMTQTVWNSLTDPKRDIIKHVVTVSKPIGQSLVNMTQRATNNWPLDGSDAEIMTNTVILNIPTRFKIPLENWNRIQSESRKSLLALAAKPYVDQLGQMANNLNWPKDSTDAPVYDVAYLEKIQNFYHVPFANWNSILVDLRGFLESITDGNAANAKQLAAAAISGNWPLDASSGHLAYAPWASIKIADPILKPEKWNKIDIATRTAILSASTDAERKKLLAKANYKKDKLRGGAEKAQSIFDNPVVDALSGGAGTSSTIAQAAEGENPTVSASIGVAAAGLDTAVQSMVMAGSIARLVRGQRMAGRGNASRAARALGRKDRREGMWGIASSTLGLGGSISSMVGSSSKLHDNEADKASGLSGDTDKASGSFALAAGGLGMTRSGIGLFKGFQRSSGAQKYVKDATATGDAKILSDIADFTSKNQNRLGKGMETAKNAFTSSSGISNIIGGTGGTISAAVFGGLGLLTGITNAVMGKVFAPSDAAVDAKTDELIALWRKPFAPAIQFAKDVLNINEPDLVAWVDEDPDAAKDLIKSKLSKY